MGRRRIGNRMLTDIRNCLFLIYRLYNIYYKENDYNVAKLKKAAYNCGAIGVKLLQFIISHDGFLTPECQNKFSDVYEDCRAHSWQETRAMYEEDFGHDLEEDYEVIDDQVTLVGAGSIAQVYRLRDRNTGEVVAMKVRHPGVEEDTERFLANIQCVFRAVGWVSGRIPFLSLIEDFMENVRVQLNYEQEVANTMRMREYFASEPAVIIPQVYGYSRNFIVMSYHEGTSVYDIRDRRLLRNIYMDVYFFTASSILVHDFLHCDLHPGNWKVQLCPEKPGDYKLIVYDCGIMASTESLETNRRILHAIYAGEYEDLVRTVVPGLDGAEASSPEAVEVLAFARGLDQGTGMTKKERFATLLRQVLRSGIAMDHTILRCIQGLILCSDTLLSSLDRFCKLLESDEKEVVFFYLKGVLERTGRYTDFLRVVRGWVTEPGAEEAFLGWLDEHFGHRDESVFHEVIWRAYEMGDINTE